jgi:toxin ParE1/3/4
VKVCWTNAATEHLSAIQDYIAEKSPFFARRMVERLINRSEQIGEFPHSGREVPEYDADESER